MGTRAIASRTQGEGDGSDGAEEDVPCGSGVDEGMRHGASK